MLGKVIAGLDAGIAPQVLGRAFRGELGTNDSDEESSLGLLELLGGDGEKIQEHHD